MSKSLSSKLLSLGAVVAVALAALAPTAARADDGPDRSRGRRDTVTPAVRESPRAQQHRPHRPAVHESRHAHRQYRRIAFRVFPRAGHYEFQRRRIVIPGHYETSTVPARFSVRWDRHCRTYVRVVIEPARTVRTWVPRRVTFKRERVWVPDACNVAPTPRGHGHGHGRRPEVGRSVPELSGHRHG